MKKRKILAMMIALTAALTLNMATLTVSAENEDNDNVLVQEDEGNGDDGEDNADIDNIDLGNDDEVKDDTYNPADDAVDSVPAETQTPAPTTTVTPVDTTPKTGERAIIPTALAAVATVTASLMAKKNCN